MISGSSKLLGGADGGGNGGNIIGCILTGSNHLLINISWRRRIYMIIAVDSSIEDNIRVLKVLTV